MEEYEFVEVEGADPVKKRNPVLNHQKRPDQRLRVKNSMPRRVQVARHNRYLTTDTSQRRLESEIEEAGKPIPSPQSDPTEVRVSTKRFAPKNSGGSINP